MCGYASVSPVRCRCAMRSAEAVDRFAVGWTRIAVAGMSWLPDALYRGETVVCMCVCVYVCVYVRKCVCVYIYIYIYILLDAGQINIINKHT